METYTKESILRDLIAQKIQKLKPDLTLLQKEQYIPNEYGTKSFIDLYATDEEKRHVLIELKRSDAAARFYADAGFSVEGMQIDVAKNQIDFQARPYHHYLLWRVDL